MRQAHGIEMQDSPYLPNTQTTVTNNAGTPGAWIVGMLAATGLAAGLGTIAGSYILSKPSATTAPASSVLPGSATIPVVPTFPAPQPVEFDEVEQILQPDGTWKPTGKVTRVRTMPDGAVQTKQPDGTWK